MQRRPLLRVLALRPIPSCSGQGIVVDEARATDRAMAVLAASGYSGSVTIEGDEVTVTVSAVVA